MSIDHYENFPVASILLPARLRPAVEAIYAFARSADDLADEGDAEPEARLHALAAYEFGLDLIARRAPRLIDVRRRWTKSCMNTRLPLQPLRDLLSAFQQDVVTTRYAELRSAARLLPPFGQSGRCA